MPGATDFGIERLEVVLGLAICGKIGHLRIPHRLLKPLLLL
jgi:hypothetical protein